MTDMQEAAGEPPQRLLDDQPALNRPWWSVPLHGDKPEEVMPDVLEHGR